MRQVVYTIRCVEQAYAGAAWHYHARVEEGCCVKRGARGRVGRRVGGSRRGGQCYSRQGGGATDSLGDELLELAGDEAAEFGLSKASGADVNLYTMTAEELGIQSRLSIDNEPQAKQNDLILTRALRTWAKDMRDRERSRKLRDARPSHQESNGKRLGSNNDYDSDSAESQPQLSKAARRTRSSSAANGSRRRSSRFGEEEAGGIEAAQQAIRSARTRYLVEKAKLQFARDENVRLWKSVHQLEEEEKLVKRECTVALEQALVYELGQDVDAIFTPPGSPKRGEQSAEVQQDELAVRVV